MKTAFFASLAFIAAIASTPAYAIVELSQSDSPNAFSTMAQSDDAQYAVLSGNLAGVAAAHPAGTVHAAILGRDDAVLSYAIYRQQAGTFRTANLSQGDVPLSARGQMDGGDTLPISRMAFPLSTEFGPVSLLVIGLGLLSLARRRPGQQDKFSN